MYTHLWLYMIRPCTSVVINGLVRPSVARVSCVLFANKPYLFKAIAQMRFGTGKSNDLFFVLWWLAMEADLPCKSGSISGWSAFHTSVKVDQITKRIKTLKWPNWFSLILRKIYMHLSLSNKTETRGREHPCIPRCINYASGCICCEI